MRIIDVPTLNKARERGYIPPQRQYIHFYDIVDWLREKKNIHVQIEFNRPDWEYFVVNLASTYSPTYAILLSGEAPTYDSALYQAITHTLEYMCNPDHNGECLLCDNYTSKCQLINQN